MEKDPLALFRPPTRAWFTEALGVPTRAQALGWPPIARGESTLLLAPTGSGKTLAAFLAVIDTLVLTPEPPKLERCKVLYVSPLKALAIDVERNLRAPLAGVVETARRLGVDVRVPTAVVRTGDTPAGERARMLRTPPDILITTPESLYLMLTSDARRILGSIDTVIIDEIHSLLPTKRGAHLFVSLERLEELRLHARARPPLQRIGLSATQKTVAEVAHLLGGFQAGAPRPVTVADAREKKLLEIVVAVPDADFARAGEPDPIPSGDASMGPAKRSVWPQVHADLVARIRAHQTTMVFVNSRRLAERLAAALNELAGEEIALAHHGSVAREKRAEIEDRLKRGLLPAIVATSSLELGIDMGSIDLVVQIESPPSVASGLQRIGRASHQVGGTPSGVLMPKHKGDLAACAAVAQRMRAGLVEETYYPRNPLDVLAQQIVAITCEHEMQVDVLYDLVRRAAPYTELPRSAFEGVLDMLSGRYPSDEFAELRPRLTWDRIGGRIRAREGAKRLAITNGGTIPDRGLYGVFLAEDDPKRRGGRRVGELDEEMVFELREGEVFLLGASAWRTAEITHDRVLVTPAAGERGKMPFWHGDRPGRPRELGAAIGALVRKVARAPLNGDIAEVLAKENDLDPNAVEALLAYVREQVEATGEPPSDRTIVVERYIDEIGDHRVCVLSPFGSRVHAPWTTAVLAKLQAQKAGDIDAVWSDDGMVFRVPASDEPPPADLFIPSPDEVEALVTASLADSSLFAARFRENAARALLLPRRGPAKRTPLWAQRKRSADLLAVASRHPSFPMLLETYRECLRDVFDLPGLVEILRSIRQRRIRVLTVDTRVPSPFATTLSFSFVANFIYDGDAPVAERRLQALSIDHAQLRELLGEAELRKLLDPEVIEEHERMLQRLTFLARHEDGVHDLLLRIGDLTLDDLRARCEPKTSANDWIRSLVKARRAIEIRISGEKRFVAAEDAGRFRDALGVVPPRGMPDAFLEAVADPMGDLVRRFARTHGPFRRDQVTARFGTSAAAIAPAIARLLKAGTLVEGAFLPDGTSGELCDAEVLAALRRKSVAELRREVEPVEPAAYARFLLEWQGVSRPRRGADALLTAIGQLEGCPLPASSLEREILPARVAGYLKWDLDELCASGEVVWCGIEPVGTADGRIALYLADHEALLAPRPRELEGETAAAIRAHLLKRGASFFAEIARALGGYPGETLDVLWDMVWAGEVTNDTLEPLRSLRRGTATTTARGRDRRTPRARGARGGPPGSEGRWSLRSARAADAPPSDTARSAALARTLLDRYGIVTREVTHAEGIVGGFSAVYDVLKAMEESGRARRGYFVAGRGAAQFAAPGADERLRLVREPGETKGTLVLAAVDPANPYGASIPWPETRDGARPQRAAGAEVILHDGELVAYLARGEETLLTFLPREEPGTTEAAHAVARGLSGLAAARGRRAVLVKSIDGNAPGEHPIARQLLEAGFLASGSGYMFRARAGANASESDAREEADAVDVETEHA